MIERNQVTFTWDKATDTLCSSILYVTSAINCGVCPNTTADANITCVYTLSDFLSLDKNYTCMFAVQTEIVDIYGENGVNTLWLILIHGV